MHRLASGSSPRAARLVAACSLTFAIVAGACAANAPATPSAAPDGSASAPILATSSPSGGGVPSPSPEDSTMATPSASQGPIGFLLTSPSFADGEPIPREHSCRGADVSPPLAWTGVPAGAAALVLLVDDPDARDWVHWIVLDLPASDGGLPQGVAPSADPPRQGRNDFGRVGYGGPCPPSGNHHYRFTLYALAAPLGLAGHPDGTAVRAALRGSTVLATAILGGTFRA